MIYSWLWRKLPGSATLKIMVLFASAAAIVWSLFAFVFPAIDLFLNSDPTLES